MSSFNEKPYNTKLKTGSEMHEENTKYYCIIYRY